MEPIREYVMNVVVNDYGYADLIVREVSEWAASENVAVTTAAIVAALADLVKCGLIGCFAYSQEKKQFERADFSADDKEQLFLITDLGKGTLRKESDSSRPSNQ